MKEIDFGKLAEPFPESQVDWRIQKAGLKDGKPWALVVPFLDSRAIQDRLDAVCSPANWQNEFTSGPDGGVLCGLSIRCPSVNDILDGAWVTKWDGAEASDIEAVKGGLSGAMKRAAVQWGIGRYLYSYPSMFANITGAGSRKGRVQDVNFRWNPPSLSAPAAPQSEQSRQSDDKPKVNGKRPSDPKRTAFLEAIQASLATLNADGVAFFGDSARNIVREKVPQGTAYKVLENIRDLLNLLIQPAVAPPERTTAMLELAGAHNALEIQQLLEWHKTKQEPKQEPEQQEILLIGEENASG